MPMRYLHVMGMRVIVGEEEERNNRTMATKAGFSNLDHGVVAVVVMRLASQSQLSMMCFLYLRIMPRKASWSSRSGTVTAGGMVSHKIAFLKRASIACWWALVAASRCCNDASAAS